MKYLLLAAPALFRLCGPPDPESKPLPPRMPSTIPDEKMASVVRIDLDKQFRGGGVIVSEKGFVVTTLSILDGYKHKKAVLTIGEDRTLARVYAANELRGIAILQASAPLVNAAPFADDDARKETSQVVVVGYDTLSRIAKIIKKKQFSATIMHNDVHVEMVHGHDGRGSLEMISQTDGEGFYRGGAVVLEPETGNFIGIIFGDRYPDDYNAGPYYATPANEFAAELDIRNIDYAKEVSP